ncbi:MAG: hypothetical protein Q8Q09_19095 [Deltaproteobacteria bacterium]|nr:hypothetical protein [Deltaproteobacteria bacterium]
MRPKGVGVWGVCVVLWVWLAACGGTTPPDGGGPDAMAAMDAGEGSVSDREAPTWPEGAALGAVGGLDRVVFRWPEARDNVGVVGYRVRREGAPERVLTGDARSLVIDGLALDARVSLEVQALDAAGNASGVLRASGTATVPNPQQIAPPIGPFEGGPTARTARFLFEGEPPVQSGYVAGSIDDARIAVLRGRVVDRAGVPVRRLRVSIVGAPGLGFTLTRDDGR